jgi:hypothetical protein
LLSFPFFFRFSFSFPPVFLFFRFYLFSFPFSLPVFPFFLFSLLFFDAVFFSVLCEIKIEKKSTSHKF